MTQREIAEQWLSAALLTALERHEVLARDRDDPAYAQAAAVAFALLQQRHRVRRDLDLLHDEYDDLADRLADAVDEVLEGEHGADVGTALLFWPQKEFDELLRRWPVLAQAYGQSWDEHRGKLERGLQLWSESGVTGLEPGRDRSWPPGLNEPCCCGSGLKYKKCCLPRSRT